MRKREQRLIWLPTGGHIGDAIMIVSLFGEALQKNSDLKITYLVRRNASAIAELCEAYPAITVQPLPYAPMPAFMVVCELLKKRSAVVVPPARVVHPKVIKLLAVLFMLRGDRVIGFQDPRDHTKWHPYHTLIHYDPEERYIDNLRKSLALVPLVTEPRGTPPHLAIKSSMPAGFPFTNQSYIVIHAFGHMSTTKSMPLRRWKDLIRALRRAYPLYGIVVTGAEADRRDSEELAVVDTSVYAAIGLSIHELAGVIEHATLYIGIDTGPSHIAGVLHVPSLILAQQNDPIWLPDYNPHAVMIWSKQDCVCGISGQNCITWEDGKPYRRCVYGLTEEAILKGVRGII